VPDRPWEVRGGLQWGSSPTVHMKSMIESMSTKARVTVTISQGLLARIDRAARNREGASRSSIIEEWLRSAAEHQARRALDEAIADYYDGMTAEERDEGAEWARFSTASFAVREGAEPGPKRGLAQKRGARS